MGFWWVGSVSIELAAPLTFILTKFQPEKCRMSLVPTIFHNFHRSGIYWGPSETCMYRSGRYGITREVPELSSNTHIFGKLVFRVHKMTRVSENGHFVQVKTLLSRVLNLNSVHEGSGR